MNKTLSVICSLIVIVSAVLGAWLYIDKNYAQAASLEYTNMRLEQKIVNDAIRDTMWNLRMQEDILELKPGDKKIKRKIEDYTLELDVLMKKKAIIIERLLN